MFETEIILKLWLKIVPEYTVVFTQLVIVNILIDCISGSLMTAAQASGRLKIYQSVVGGLLLLNLPMSYVFLKFGLQPEITFYTSIFISILALIARLFILRYLIKLKIIHFFYKVIIKIVLVSSITIFFLLIFQLLLYNTPNAYIFIVLTALITALGVVIFVGLNKNERKYLINFLHENRLNNFK